MKKTNKVIITSVIVAVLLLGIGYAAIQNITLNIAGTAAADPSQANFKVMFSGTPTVSDDTYVTAAITDEINATMNVTGLTKKGDVVSATYTVQNASEDLSADLSVATTNSNTEFFTLSSEIDKTSLTAGEATTLTVTVELTKTPIVESVNATIGVQLEAMPVQPGEEGTSEGINGSSQTPESNIPKQNEYGFYYEQRYSDIITIQDGLSEEKIMFTMIFCEDASCEIYANGVLMYQAPAGYITYDSFCIDLSALGDDFPILTVSSDGREIYVTDEIILELSEVGNNPIPTGAMYGHINSDSISWYDTMPRSVMMSDIFLYGDYIYIYLMDGWQVQLATEDLMEFVSDYKFTDKNQTSYGQILESVNGKPVTNMNNTFEKCTSLIVAPEIPRSVTNMCYTFNECTGLTTAPEIPNGVTDMSSTFNKCTGLTTAPEIPNSVTNMSFTFNECTGLTIAPKIPNSVTDMSSTFNKCTGLTTAPEIPNSVTDMSSTFNKCTGLTTAPEIPNSVTNMSSTFRECIGITIAPEIPNSVTNMSHTFYGCTGLTTTPKISNGVIDMSCTFYGCTGLTNVLELPSTVRDMSFTFCDCTSLTSVPDIPASVTRMRSTFEKCSALTIAPVILGNVTDMSYAFQDCKSLTIAPEIPNSVTDMSLTFYGCKSLTTAPEIPNSVTNMKTTFSGCTGLTIAPKIPSSVTDMAFTFYGCTSLTGTITINTNNITSIEYYNYCFNNVDMSKITLTGEASKETLNKLGSTGRNYTPIP